MMDTSDYDQISLPSSVTGGALDWIQPNDEVDVLFVDGRPADIQVPSAVELTVTETDPGLRGDSVSGGGNKPATLESGVIVQVPLFVNTGDRVRVDTRSGEYVSRA
jgi:elongation factor P